MGKKDIKIEHKRSNNLSKLKLPRIKVIGVGGGGSSIVEEIFKILKQKKAPFLSRVDFVAANVDLQAIRMMSKNVKTIYFGEDVTYGLGCGMNPELGKEAAIRAKDKFTRELKNADFCILVSCLGGGTGSGAVPQIAQLTSLIKIPTLGIFTTPFQFEGIKRKEIAKQALDNAKKSINAYIVIPNQKIFSLIKPQTTLQKSFSLINRFLAEILEGLLEIIYLPGLINIDFADIKTILKGKEENAYLSSALVKGKNKTGEAINLLFKNPLFGNRKDYDKILFNINTNKDTKMKEIQEICRAIHERNLKAKIIFGISRTLVGQDQIKITFLATKKKELEQKRKPSKKDNALKEQKIKIAPSKKKSHRRKGTKSKIVRKPKIKEDIIKEVEKIQKSKVRRNALEVLERAKEAEKKLLEEEKKWETPAFLKKNAKKYETK